MQYRTGIIFVLTAGVFWSFHGLFIRMIDDAQAWTIWFWRSAAMLPVLWIFLSVRSGGVPVKALRSAGFIGALGGVAFALAMGSAIVAFQTTTVANAAFLLAASPFLAALIGLIILKETVSNQTKASIALAIIGIFVMVKDGLEAGAMIGNAAGLASAFGFAFFTVTLRWSKAKDSLPASFLGASLSVVVAGVAALVTHQGLSITASDLFWCVVMGMITMSGGTILYTLGSKTVSSAELTLLSNTEVLLSPFWAWLILGELASFGTLLGGTIVLIAISYSALSKVRRKPTAVFAAPA